MYGKGLEAGNSENPQREMKGGDRIDFLNNKTPAVMYLWYILLINDLLTCLFAVFLLTREGRRMASSLKKSSFVIL
jgi:hypothetical protein